MHKGIPRFSKQCVFDAHVCKFILVWCGKQCVGVVCLFALSLLMRWPFLCNCCWIIAGKKLRIPLRMHWYSCRFVYKINRSYLFELLMLILGCQVLFPYVNAKFGTMAMEVKFQVPAVSAAGRKCKTLSLFLRITENAIWNCVKPLGTCEQLN